MSSTWVPAADSSGFPVTQLPYGVFSTPDARPAIGVGIGNFVLVVGAIAQQLRLPYAPLLAAAQLNPFMAAGPAVWKDFRDRLTELLTDERHRPTVAPHLVPLGEVALHLPFAVADYVDFYASEHHATRLGEILRPGQPALPANWKQLPIGYHGRSATAQPSGTPVIRPCGQRLLAGETSPSFGPSRRLDFEAEVGFVVGVPSRLGEPLPLEAFESHVFGACLVNDWSARDIQAFEYVPLGPFLGKSFLTSVSPWVVPLAALAAARTTPPPRSMPLATYLDDSVAADGTPWGLDITLEVRLNGHPVSRPTFRDMYWTPAQQLAHLTVNGACVRTGDLYASGTVSGPALCQSGSLIELTANGREPLRLPDETTRAFLEDGDEVTISATAPGPGGSRVDFGSVRAVVHPARRT